MLYREKGLFVGLPSVLFGLDQAHYEHHDQYDYRANLELSDIGLFRTGPNQFLRSDTAYLKVL